jgi:hypothetical protein
MAGNKYLQHDGAGRVAEVAATQTSAGSGDAGKIPALDANGRLATTMMPTGIAADTASIVASEALADGDLVNVWSNGGTPNVRKADASSSGKEAHGFVLASVSSSGTAVVYFEGTNGDQTGLTAGVQYLSDTTPGKATTTVPTTAGHVVQRVGEAYASTGFQFHPQLPIVLA